MLSSGLYNDHLSWLRCRDHPHPDRIVVDGKPNDNMAAPLLAQALGGEIFFAFISAVAFATILAVVSGLTISASTSFAHDFYTNVIHHGSERGRPVKRCE